MPRLDGLDGTQRALLEAALRRSHIDRLAEVCEVHPRSVRDWRREQHRIPLDSLKRIYQEAGLLLPTSLRLLPDFWHIREAARLGGQRRAQLYGPPPATLEGRRKGGRTSCERFRTNPGLAKARGFILRKPIKRPRKSVKLAEFVGIMLGDGCLSSRFQVGIAFNAETDRAYGAYLQQLFRTLFGLSATIQQRADSNGWTVVASSRALVEYLQTLGLVAGNKVTHQVDVPEWVLAKPSYQRACLRGLIDTDGSIYRYAHRVNGGTYEHSALCFTNHSQPLLRSVQQLLINYGFRPQVGRYHVFLNRQTEICRYFQIVGTRNLKHLTRFQQYFKGHSVRRGARVVESAVLEKR